MNNEFSGRWAAFADVKSATALNATALKAAVEDAKGAKAMLGDWDLFRLAQLKGEVAK